MGNLTYRDAGVNNEAQDHFADSIGSMARTTIGPEVLAGIGGFAAAVAPDLRGMERPVLVSGTDGVGTKLKIAFALDRHDTVGIDLVAMCVNDVITTGARPLFFLDYFATGRLQEGVALQVMSGIVEGCNQAECALVGGETAELPGFYAPGEYDLAGFCVGIVDAPRQVTGQACRDGDVLVGLRSSGVHSNGFSLVRRVVELRGLSLDRVHEGFPQSLGEVLLTPTRIYWRAVKALLSSVPVHAMAHITGGGLEGNLPRVIPEGLHPVVRREAIPVLPILSFLQGAGGEPRISDEEMWRVFNMGVGYVIVVPPEDADRAMTLLRGAGEEPFVLGHLAPGSGDLEWM
ncbi:MAG TPA: phosphoribosylformylglycinamidine cyclo-ligase [Myxococcota bacterium]|nr:phosphoribosylformylglycinamidine cyclo-ligase [Myxococcota bacterium]HQK50496.1 phosphoribosylformylglycinamidine cyclo-ligase [Myxococcota bacterium]